MSHGIPGLYNFLYLGHFAGKDGIPFRVDLVPLLVGFERLVYKNKRKVIEQIKERYFRKPVISIYTEFIIILCCAEFVLHLNFLYGYILRKNMVLDLYKTKTSSTSTFLLNLNVFTH